VTGRKVTGAQGEAVAAAYLRRNGYLILATNWRCRLGEIDIIARDGPVLVFVEVRARRSTRLGTPEESVTATKQRRLVDLAQTYLLFLETAGRPWAGAWRIDVVAVEIDPADGLGVRLNHLPNAVEGA
jgi:putative endonuclease